jgi:hypothetical protein
MVRTRLTAPIAAFLATLLVATTAMAAPAIHVGKGVGGARLGQKYKTAAGKLSKTYKTVKDKNYSYVVYHTYVGKRMKNKRYPIELYSRSNRKVFRFQINSSGYKTAKGVKIGSKETAVKSKYPTAAGPFESGTYTRYRITHKVYSYKTYTEFYCKSGKVAFIIVRR